MKPIVTNKKTAPKFEVWEAAFTLDYLNYKRKLAPCVVCSRTEDTAWISYKVMTANYNSDQYKKEDEIFRNPAEYAEQLRREATELMEEATQIDNISEELITQANEFNLKRKC